MSRAKGRPNILFSEAELASEPREVVPAKDQVIRLCVVTSCCNWQRPELLQKGDSLAPLLKQRECQNPAGKCQLWAMRYVCALCSSIPSGDAWGRERHVTISSEPEGLPQYMNPASLGGKAYVRPGTPSHNC